MQDDLYDLLLPFAREAHDRLELDEEGEPDHYCVIKAGPTRKSAGVVQRVPMGYSPEELARSLEEFAAGWAGESDRLYVMVYQRKGTAPVQTRPIPVGILEPTSTAQPGAAFATDRMAAELSRTTRYVLQQFGGVLQKNVQLTELVSRAYLESQEAQLHAQHSDQPSEAMQAFQSVLPLVPYMLAGRPPQLPVAEEEPAPAPVELPPDLDQEQAAAVARGLVGHLCALCKAHPDAVVPELAPLLQVEEVVNNLLQLA